MRRAGLLAAALLLLANRLPERSRGYGGSTPVGQGTALATADCRALQSAVDTAKPGMAIPLFDDCPLVIRAPGEPYVAVVDAGDAPILTIREGQAGKALLRIAFTQPMQLLWRQDGRAFLLNDGEGSGQTSHLRVFMLREGRWQESGRLHRTSQRAYFSHFDCWKGAYTNVSGRHWTREGRVVVIVQEGVHSAGCLLPPETRAFEVTGDPWTGSLYRTRSVPWKSVD